MKNNNFIETYIEMANRPYLNKENTELRFINNLHIVQSVDSILLFSGAKFLSAHKMSERINENLCVVLLKDNRYALYIRVE